MNVDAQKLEIIEWVSKLQDSQIVQELLTFREKKMVQGKIKIARKVGDGKHLISYVAEDFNDPINFNEEEPKTYKKEQEVERKFGDGKYLIEYIAEDFNDPIEHFGEDTRP